ncbi:hypothetical protein ISF_03989 [Cordyceps fumosorosea ARSEF 2679]|uniref:SRm160/300 splicing coactivator n=1 Tax=Cordyceps fumosorosea (strain ARSEF 2679) TaxID=1081104 RepID=A0A167YCA5_CORFA|nr:hypothetical protein ISF_03989 [Cordyceps fumosorosea ARSEF 2679]OAA66151.1 hypothetical protein ISF_03989 [Cordyceps fumosorosea ARSEF 2679]
MPSESSPSEPERPPPPTTPRKPRNRTSPETPRAKIRASPGDAPHSAPAAAQAGRRNDSKKPEPTLLTDFFHGRQSAARVAADRKRRQSVDAVKAELRANMRLEMRQSSVRKLQQPSGVRERVHHWQRKHGTTMATSNPNYAATEPDDVAFDGEDLESVTEEDRVRIKMRQRSNPPAPKFVPNRPNHDDNPGSSGRDDAAEDDARSLSPPKKRVVSDSNWMRQKPKKSPPRKVTPSSSKETTPQISKAFVLHPTPNPPVSSKIKAWAAKIEMPDEYESGSQVGSAASRSTARLKPKYKQFGDDDGIRVSGSNDSSVVRDDGIRVRPTTTGSNISFPGQTYRPPTGRRSKSIAASSRSALSIEASDISSPSSEGTKKPVRRRSKSMSTDKKESVNDTPTKTASKRRARGQRDAMRSYLSASAAETDTSSHLGDDVSNLSSSLRPDSDMDSKLTAKTLADNLGDIPFGHSAFSELDLSGRYRPKKLNVDRKSSFKGVPHVFKKVVEEGKKIMKDMNEPPRPQAPNKPPSIEKWLSTTVDPFIETPKEAPAPIIKTHPATEDSVTTQNTAESKVATSSSPKEAPRKSSAVSSDDVTSTLEGSETPLRTETVRRRRAHTVGAQKRHSKRHSQPEQTSDISSAVTDETATELVEEKREPKEHLQHAKDDTKGSSSMELKRTRAKRATSSPLRNKEGFLGMFKNAFSGESAAFAGPGKAYRTEEPQRHELHDQEYTDDYTDGSALSSRDTESQLTQSTASDHHANIPRMVAPRHPPPTKGHHELSTIMSDDGSSAVSSALTGSDATSRITQSTGTESTIMSKTSHASLKKQHSLAKRRITSHSDLMSVLSLPDQAAVPQSMKNRSRPSLRRKQGVPAGFSENELLQEFEDDENLYNRELKTLVDGVIPVLLGDVVNNSDATTLFSTGGGSQADAISKAVVGMGVALEKLKNAHKKAPLQDIRRLAHWAHGVVPMYNSYLSAWRLGFQDLVVNLAPASGKPDDEDSLLDALPRNEHGDIINEDGERVAVGYLLKRPLVRIKHMTKLIKCIDSIINSQDTSQLLRDFENLQEKSRRRHREETARIEDEDAINTDVTRCRDIRTLGAITPPAIDPHLQVNAKDTFALFLAHSNGQRLQCRVELVYRDNPLQPKQPGDLLIREPGDGKEGRKSYLLFPPIQMHLCSARTGDSHFDMAIMLRGVYDGRAWHELLFLTADDEDQILDWLDLLPLNPVPLREPEPSVVGDDEPDRFVDIPVGVPTVSELPDRAIPAADILAARPQSPLVKSPQDPQTPKRERTDAGRDEAQSLSTPESDHDKTPTQPTYNVEDWDDRGYREEDDLLPQPLKIKKASPPRIRRDDEAPPPPAHRTLPPTPEQQQKDPNLLAPPEPTERIKRRRSSPLKHEYLPSDASSGGSSSPSPEQSDDDSSDDDDIDSMDIPETELGVSIPNEAHQSQKAEPKHESVLSQSDYSITPSNSASQACGVHPPRSTAEQQENTTRFMASLSRWSEKGAWKDLSNHPCVIVVSAGLVEAYAFRTDSDPSKSIKLDEQPLIALDLTPLVLIRQSTALDLEVRSSVQMHSRLYEKCNGGNFRFRCHSAPECFALYMAVHQARLSNQKFIQLENEARFRGFGERHEPEEDDRAGRRRSWFGRKNSYRSSPRSAARSQDGESAAHSSTPSATSFLKRLTQSGNSAFSLEHSSIDRQSRGGSGRNSLYTSGSSSASGASPRSPSVSTGNTPGHRGSMDAENIRIRLHLLVSSTKWEDCGNCILKIRRPPPGWHQALLADHGLEKRITVQSQPKKDDEEPKVLLDAVLGSGCFSAMGSRGIVCGIWEEVQGANGVVGMVPAKSNPGGKIKKWCFQLSTAAEANWVLRMVHQEVVRA